MKNISLEKTKKEIQLAVSKISQIEDLEKLKSRLIGRKGLITSLSRKTGKLPLEKRPHFGKEVNDLKKETLELLKKTKKKLEQKSFKKIDDIEDITLPGIQPKTGNLHPITQTTRLIIDIFKNIGFNVAEGPEIESDWYCFEALNIPFDHPARDMQDTFYISKKTLLRTHTSPVQIRIMEKEPPPIRIICPGKTFRRDDSDTTHSPMFHQIEGLMVDEDISFSNLKHILTIFVKQIFGKKINTRFRPSYFPFTEPSAELDISCVLCNGVGCRVCNSTGWLEIMGSGMVHPNVFKSVNYDFHKFSGFAFGMGIERITMLLWGIDDIRILFENDLRFLKQF